MALIKNYYVMRSEDKTNGSFIYKVALSVDGNDAAFEWLLTKEIYQIVQDAFVTNHWKVHTLNWSDGPIWDAVFKYNS